MKDDQFIFETMPIAGLDSNPAAGPTGQQKIRRIQSALNRALGLQLPLDGLMNFRTRRAIRMFQREKGIPADGIINQATERALIAASSGQSSRAGAAKSAEPDMSGLLTSATLSPAAELDTEWESFENERGLHFPGYESEAETSAPAQRSVRSTTATTSSVRKYPPFSLTSILQRTLGRARPKQELEFFGEAFEIEGELTGPRLTSAVTANRRLARQLGWGCVVGDRLQLNESPSPRLYQILDLGARPSEEDFAQAVEQFQVKELGQRTGDGQLGPGTWQQLLRRNVLPANRFAPFSKPISFIGRKLGILEKTRAYERCFFDPVIDAPCRAARSGIAGEGGGAIIELGFRVTDIDAVRRAGFVDGFGTPFFRWIQVVEFVTRPVLTPAGDFTGRFVRRASGEIDPMAVAGVPPEQLDLHPYYWDEVTHPGAHPGLNVDQWVNRRAQNGLCYDLIFMDRATFPLSTVSPPAPWTRPGSHAYFNFELALVGVRPGPPIQNFVLYTVKWGYDIFMKGGQPNVDLNGLHPGPTNGSPALKKILNREFNRDDVPFPGHCMAGSGYTGRAICKK